MAGLNARLNNGNCEVPSNMVNIDVISGMSTSPDPWAAPSAIKLEGESIGDGLQEGAALTFGTTGTVQEEDLVPFKVVAGSGEADFVEPDFNKLGPHVDAPAIYTENSRKCIKSHQLLGAEEGFCNSLNDSSDLEVKSLMETQPPKGVQVCAICHEKIKREETAEIKGCEHSYCVSCILCWATYKTQPWCPQCRLPFSFLYVYRALDGSLSDYLIEESVCLLLRAFWFKPLVVEEVEEQDDYQDYYDAYEEPYYTSNVRLGNRRWGDSGYVRAGRCEARPVGVRQVGEPGSSSSRQAKGKEPAKEAVGRRARRAQKREQLDKKLAKK